MQGGDFLTEQRFSRDIAPCCQLTCERHEVVDAVEVTTSTQSQRLIKCVLKMTMRRLNVPVLMWLANVYPMAFETVVIQQLLILGGEFSVAGKVVHRGG
jgi:hypothetical protein